MWEEVGLKQEHLHLVHKVDHRLIYSYTKSRGVNSGQTVQWFIFYMHTPDLKLCKLDNEEVPEFTIMKWGDWDSLIQDCPPNKHEMFIQLRVIAEPVITTFLGTNNVNIV